MPLKIYNPQNIDLIGQIDLINSVQLERCFADSGTFTMSVPYDPVIYEMLKKDNYITIDGDGTRAAVIEDITIDEGDAATVTVNGKTLNSLISRRINLQNANPAIAALNFGYDMVPETTRSGEELDNMPCETIAKTYIDRHMINPTDVRRKIPCMVCAPDKGRGKRYKWLAKNGDVLSDTITAICKYSNFGYTVYLDSEQHKIVFDITPPSQSNAVFGVCCTNITGVRYDEAFSGYKNIGYAAGQSYDDYTRLIQQITQEGEYPTGVSRREVYIDCGNLSSVETDSAFSLEYEASRRMAEYIPTRSISPNIAAPLGIYNYRTDYDLGSIVTAQLLSLGLEAQYPITKITEKHDSGGMDISVSLGTLPDGLAATIKKIAKGSI